jgi:hypothetical protein
VTMNLVDTFKKRLREEITGVDQEIQARNQQVEALSKRLEALKRADELFDPIKRRLPSCFRPPSFMEAVPRARWYPRQRENERRLARRRGVRKSSPGAILKLAVASRRQDATFAPRRRLVASPGST